MTLWACGSLDSDKQTADARASRGNIDKSISFENAVAEDGTYTGQKNKEGKRHGVGKLEFKNEDLYEGIFIDNVRHGEGTMRFITIRLFLLFALCPHP